MPDQLIDAYAARLRALDPLLGVDTVPPAGDVLDAGSTRGWARVVDIDPAEAAATWSRLRTYGLAPRWTGDVAELEALVTAWVEWMRKAGSDDAGHDSQTSITWPARDVDAGRVFVAHGLSPSTTIAVRPHGRDLLPVRDPHGVTVRRARTEDAPAVVALTVEELRFEGGLSPASERPGHDALRRQEAANLLAGTEPWAWVAERDGAVVGVLTASRPSDATWIGGMTSAQPAAYLSLLSVLPGTRGGGVGAALTGVALRTFDEAGAAATLLHYGTFNPLSVPFWSRHGFRPLWTVWAAAPAAATR